jgi:plastocyanin
LNRSVPRLLPLIALPLVLLVAAACSSKSNNSAAVTSQSFDQVTTDNKFSIAKMTTAANQPVTVIVSNKGQALHNFHVSNVQDAAGKEIKDELVPAGGSNTLTFTIAKAGTYNFVCDVHPIDMKGTIAVR